MLIANQARAVKRRLFTAPKAEFVSECQTCPNYGGTNRHELENHTNHAAIVRQ
jgi:hypothetical protein